MSYNMEGKIANQNTWVKLNGSALCGKCRRCVNRPEFTELKIEEKTFTMYHYIGTKNFIYETKRGIAVVYCSDYCRKKHNHRFN